MTHTMTMVEQIEEQLRPFLEERQFELIETHYRRESGQWLLRIYIDKLGEEMVVPRAKKGSQVTLDDCEKVSEAVGMFLDSTHLLERSYVLEVSSPGINRPLKTESHFKSYLGEKVKINLLSPLVPESKQRNFSGILLGCQDQKIEVQDLISGKVEIPLSSIAKAHLDII